MTTLATACLTVAAAGLPPAGSASASSARLTRPIVLTGPTGYPQAVIAAASAPSGIEAFAWTKWSAPGFPRGHSRVVARVRLADGRFASAQTLSPAGGRAFLPAIGIDRAGRATAVWFQQVSARPLLLDVVVATRAPGARFGPPVVIGHAKLASWRRLPELDEGDFFGLGPALAVAPDGTAVVAWRSSQALEIATRHAGRCATFARRACFSAPQDFPHGSAPKVELHGPFAFAAAPQIVFGKHDLAYVVWGGSRGIELACARGGRGFGAARQLSPTDRRAADPSIALAPNGAAVIAWSSEPPPSGGARIVVMTVSPAGLRSAPVTLASGPAGNPYNTGVEGAPTVLINPRGEALVDWETYNNALVESVRAPNGSMGAVQLIAALMGDQLLAIDARGDSLLVYTAGPDAETFWSLRPAGGIFGQNELLPSSWGGPPFLVSRGADAFTIGWTTPTATFISDLRIG